MTSKKENITVLEAIKLDYHKIKEDLNDPVKKKKRKRRAAEITTSIFRTFLLVGLSFIILAPILQKISFAIRHPYDLANPLVVWIPQTYSTMNIYIAYLLLDYWNSLLNTTILSAGNMVLQIMATAIAGYAFARLRFKGSNIIFALVLFTLAVPNEALHVSRKVFFNFNTFLGVNLLKSVFSMFIMSAFGMGIRSAIFIYIFRQFFRNIPIELEESAQIDGAGVIRTFWSVMLPNASGAIVTVGLFSFVWQWNDFYFASLYGLGNKMPLLTTKLAGATERIDSVIHSNPTIMQIVGPSIQGNQLFFGLIANTAALLMMMPLLIAYFFVQRLFVESVERTGITGM